MEHQAVTITTTAIMPDGQVLTTTATVTADIDPVWMVLHGIVSAARSLETAAAGWVDARPDPSRHSIPEAVAEPLPQRLAPGGRIAAPPPARNSSGSYLTPGRVQDETQAWPRTE